MKGKDLKYLNKYQSYILCCCALVFKHRLKKINLIDDTERIACIIYLIKDIKKHKSYLIKIEIGEIKLEETERGKEVFKRINQTRI